MFNPDMLRRLQALERKVRQAQSASRQTSERIEPSGASEPSIEKVSDRLVYIDPVTVVNASVSGAGSYALLDLSGAIPEGATSALLYSQITIAPSVDTAEVLVRRNEGGAERFLHVFGAQDTDRNGIYVETPVQGQALYYLTRSDGGGSFPYRLDVVGYRVLVRTKD